jgi:Transglycosylase SLT domain
VCYDLGFTVWNRAILSLVIVTTVLSGLASTSSAGTFWARERPGGVIEFTNKTPREGVGHWKVWLQTGPGKASALRGQTDLVPARDTSPTRFARYDQHIRDQQAFYGIPEALVRAVIKTESDFDPAVVSSAGAQGLMQLMPDTARLMGVTDSFDPRQNIMGGARYLQLLARRFCRQVTSAGTVCTPDDKVKVVAAYHAGPGAVEKYGGLPPYETTRAYVAAVLRRYAEYAQALGRGDADAEADAGHRGAP